MYVVESIHYQGTRNRRHPQDGFVETPNKSCIGSYYKITIKASKESESELIRYQAMDLIRGSEFQRVSTNS